MSSQREQLIEYLRRFWYRDPSKCINKKWIEDHASEIRMLQHGFVCHCGFPAFVFCGSPMQMLCQQHWLALFNQR